MEKRDYIIRLEKPEDYSETENLTREAFWNVYRPGCYEHYVLHSYRNKEDFVPQLDFVMEKDGKFIGHIMYVNAHIICSDGRKIPVMTFGPISILPEFQKKGYGRKLLEYSMEKANNIGAGALFIEGNIEFYGKSGFSSAVKKGIYYNDEPVENDVPYFLCKELKEGFLEGISGRYYTPKGYFVDENEVEKFDLNFPPKKKLKLPGQLV